jgi:hypothetical protein
MMDILGGPWGIIILYWLVVDRGVWPGGTDLVQDS